MKFFKILIFILSLTAPFFSMAAGGIVMLKDSSPLNATEITADKDGNIYCFDGKQQIIVPKSFYSYIRLAKTDEIKLAEVNLNTGKYAEAERMFRDAAVKYEYLGWKAFCVSGLAKALLRQERGDAAVVELEKIIKDHIDDPDFTQWQYMEAFRLLSGIYLQKNLDEKAVAILEEMIDAEKSEYIVFAYNLLGDIALKQGRNDVAELNYLQAVIYGDKSIPARAEPVFKLAEMLKKRKDAAYKLYYEILKKDYPASDWVRKISEK
jgi:tetratricopeptide (TPR) repeat protein